MQQASFMSSRRCRYQGEIVMAGMLFPSGDSFNGSSWEIESVRLENSLLLTFSYGLVSNNCSLQRGRVHHLTQGIDWRPPCRTACSRKTELAGGYLHGILLAFGSQLMKSGTRGIEDAPLSAGWAQMQMNVCPSSPWLAGQSWRYCWFLQRG